MQESERLAGGILGLLAWQPRCCREVGAVTPRVLERDGGRRNVLVDEIVPIPCGSFELNLVLQMFSHCKCNLCPLLLSRFLVGVRNDVETSRSGVLIEDDMLHSVSCHQKLGCSALNSNECNRCKLISINYTLGNDSTH